MARSRVFFDGSIRWEDEALISPLTTGLLYGDGIFDVLRTYNGALFRFPDHYDRLRQSCESLRLNLLYDDENLWLIIRELLRQNELIGSSAYVRITIFGSALNSISSSIGINTHTFIHARPFTPPKANKYKSGVSTRISSYHISPYSPTAGHNTICFLPMILARRAAWQRGLDEVLIQNTEGGICAGSTTNLFTVKNGKLITPPLDDGITVDVSRGVVMEIAQELGIAVKEKRIGRKALLVSDEVFITNSLIEVMPVREIDETIIGSGECGEITALIQKAYQVKIKEECS